MDFIKACINLMLYDGEVHGMLFVFFVLIGLLIYSNMYYTEN